MNEKEKYYDMSGDEEENKTPAEDEISKVSEQDILSGGDVSSDVEDDAVGDLLDEGLDEFERDRADAEPPSKSTEVHPIEFGGRWTTEENKNVRFRSQALLLIDLKEKGYSLEDLVGLSESGMDVARSIWS